MLFYYKNYLNKYYIF